MGSTISTLIRLSADPTQATNSLEGFSGKFHETMRGIESQAVESFTRMSGISKSFFGGLAIGIGAVTALGAGMFELANKAAEVGAKIFEAHEKTGMTTQALSGLYAMAKVTGGSFDSMTMALTRATRSMTVLESGAGQNAKMFANMMGGAKAVTDLGLLPMDERLHTVAQKIFALTDAGQRNALGMTVFSRAWITNIATLKAWAEAADGGIAAAKDLNVFFDDKAAAAARQFTLEWSLFKTELNSISMIIGRELMPIVFAAMKGFSSWFEVIKHGGSIFQVFEGGIYTLMLGMNSLLERLGGEWAKEAQASNDAIYKKLAAIPVFKQYNDELAKQEDFLKKLTKEMEDQGNKLPTLSKGQREFTDRLEETVKALREELDVMNEIDKPEQAANRSYNAKVTAIEKELAAVQKLYKEKKATLAELQKAEQEADEAMVLAAQLRDAKIADVHIKEKEKEVTALHKWNQEIIKAQKELDDVGLEILHKENEKREAEQNRFSRTIVDDFKKRYAEIEKLQIQLQKNELTHHTSKDKLIKAEIAALQRGDSVWAAHVQNQIDSMEQLKTKINQLKEAVDDYGSRSATILSELSQVWQKSAALKIAAIIAHATVKIVDEIAAAQEALAEHRYVDAGLHFASAATYGVVAGKQIAGASGSGGGGLQGTTSKNPAPMQQGGGAMAPGRGGPGGWSGGPATVIILGGQSAVAQATKLFSDHVRFGGGQLYATNVKQ